MLVYDAKVHCYMHRRKDVNDAPVLRLDWVKTGDKKSLVEPSKMPLNKGTFC